MRYSFLVDKKTDALSHFLLYGLFVITCSWSTAIFASDQMQAAPRKKNHKENFSLFSDHWYVGGKVGWDNFEGACTPGYSRCNNDSIVFGTYTKGTKKVIRLAC